MSIYNEDDAIKEQILKNMKDDDELAEYISLLDKKLNYDEYKRYKILKTSYWYYKRDAENQVLLNRKIYLLSSK